MPSISGDFSFFAKDHKPENYDMVVNLGKKVLDSNGNDTGKVYVYAASHEEGGWFSGEGVKGDIIAMDVADLKGADNVYNYGSDLKSQVEAHATSLVDKALDIGDVIARPVRDYDGVRGDVHGAYHGVRHEAQELGDMINRGVGDRLDDYKACETMMEDLQNIADQLDHIGEFKADMAQDIQNSGLDDLKSDATSKPVLQNTVSIGMSG